MDKETKDTLLKVAEYASEGEKRSQSKVLYSALGICITLILCTLLFLPNPGLLHNLVGEALCGYLIVIPYGLAIALLVYYMYARAFQEKPSLEPERTVPATVVSKEIKSGTHSSGRSQMGYSFVVTFGTDDGQALELYTYEEEFGGLKEGMCGMLTYQGRYFVEFK